MSEEASGRKEVTLEKIEKYKELRRCMLCKKRSFLDMIICPRCLEFSYCSQQCLQSDQKDHKNLCTIIGLKKGILEVVSDETDKLEKEIKEHARLLDDSGDMKVLKNTTRQEDPKNPKSPKSSYGEDEIDSKSPKIFSKENQKEALTKENKDIKKRNESSLPSGHFGEMLGASSQKDLSGKTFGDGWWKAKPQGRSKEESQMDKSSTASHVASQDDVEQAANSSPSTETQSSIPRENSLNESQVKEEDSPGQAKDDGPAGQEDEANHSTPAKEVSGPVSGMDLVPYKKDPNGENDDDDDSMKWEKCFYCKKESYRMLKCSRCRAGRYCNKECQKKDFPQHKKQCARVGRFIAAIQKIPRSILFQSILGLGVPEISASLDCLGSEFQHMLFGPRYSVLLEIVGPYYHPFRHGVNVTDRDGKTTHILFYVPFEVYYHQTSFFPVPLPVPLSACLKPGNFILLLDAHWHFFLDETVGVRIDDLSDVCFILNSMN